MGRGLATIDPLSLPGALIRPATCEVEIGDRVEQLEPRMMQVLVVLVEGRGRVLSRDTLIERCWDGLNVGDDAINRVTARLRRLGQDSGAFTLETIRKVGYRLVPAGAEPAVEQLAQRSVRSPRRHAAMARALATAGLALVAVIAFRFGNLPGAIDARAEAPPAAPTPLALQRLPGRWGLSGCAPTYDFVVRGRRIIVTAPGYRAERRIMTADDTAIMGEGVLPAADRGKLFELRPDGDRLSVQDRTSDAGQVFTLCPLAPS